jgi:hypothetical protein
MSAADMQVVGWPLAAAVVDRIDSMRRRVATLWSERTRDVRSTATRNLPRAQSITALRGRR